MKLDTPISNVCRAEWLREMANLEHEPNDTDPPPAALVRQAPPVAAPSPRLPQLEQGLAALGNDALDAYTVALMGAACCSDND